MTVLQRTLILATLLLAGGCNSSSSQQRTDTLNVLFVGNSYVYFNNLPDMLEGIAHSLGDITIAAQHHTHGGHMLYEHLEDGHIQAYLDSDLPQYREWDTVILQEQSTLGARIQQARAGLIGDPENEFNTGMRGLHTLLEAHDLDVMLYMTWAKKAFPNQITDLAAAYEKMGERYAADVAPVGMAFDRVMRERPELDLYLDDGSHPSAAGSYLAACVIYSELTGLSAVGASGFIAGAPWNRSDIVENGDPVTLVDLSEDSATYLQEVAFEMTRSSAGN